MTPLTCAQLQAAVADDVTDFQPSVIQLALQVFALGGFITQLGGFGGSGGFVYAGHYAGLQPTVTPASGTGGLATDEDTGREWEWLGESWS